MARDSKDFTKLRVDLERDLYCAVGTVLDEFKARTGLQVREVDVQIARFYQVGCPTDYVLLGIETEVRI